MEWFWISTNGNEVDFTTRCFEPMEIDSTLILQCGPKLLMLPLSSWPINGIVDSFVKLPNIVNKIQLENSVNHIISKGFETSIANLQSNFWLPHARKLIKFVKFKCFQCKNLIRNYKNNNLYCGGSVLSPFNIQTLKTSFTPILFNCYHLFYIHLTPKDFLYTPYYNSFPQFAFAHFYRSELLCFEER